MTFQAALVSAALLTLAAAGCGGTGTASRPTPETAPTTTAPAADTVLDATSSSASNTTTTMQPTTTTSTTTATVPTTTTTTTTTLPPPTTTDAATVPPTTTTESERGTVDTSPSTQPTTTVPPTTTTIANSQKLNIPLEEVLTDPRLAGKLFYNSPTDLVNYTEDPEEALNRDKAQYDVLRRLRGARPDAPQYRREPLITTPAGRVLLEEYERYMRFSLHNIYNTCGGSRFPQVTPESTMYDFINPDMDRDLAIPPAGQPDNSYFRQAAQTAFDIAQFNRQSVVVQGRQMMLCVPLLFAVPVEILPAQAQANSSPHGGGKAVIPMPPSPWEFHIAAATPDHSVIVMVECYTGSDVSEYSLYKPYAISSYVWEDGKYKYHYGLTTPNANEQWNSCEHPFTVTDQFVDYLRTSPTTARPRLNIDADFEMFSFGEHSYTDRGFASFPN